MSDTGPVGIGFIGCGKIAGPYAQSARQRPERLRIAAAYDLDPQRAQAFVAEHGGVACRTLEELLARPDVDVVANLSIHTAHAATTRAALEAGRHVHSEKPLATTREEAAALVGLAEEKGLLLGCSPFVILGEAQQTLRRAIQDGIIGRPLEVVAHIMHGRPELRNPNPVPFLSPGAGPLLDVGCYPLSVLTSIFGPVRRVRGASADVLIPERTIATGPQQGETFRVGTPDHVNGLLEFGGGLPARLTASFTIGASTLPGIEVYGTEGTLTMANSFLFNSEVRFRAADSQEWKPVPFTAPPFPGLEWSRGLLDMVDALREGRNVRCTGRQAYHILDLSLAILESAAEGRSVEVLSTF